MTVCSFISFHFFLSLQKENTHFLTDLYSEASVYEMYKIERTLKGLVYRAIINFTLFLVATKISTHKIRLEWKFKYLSMSWKQTFFNAIWDIFFLHFQFANSEGTIL